MNFSAKNLIRILEMKGFYYKRTNGSHKLFYNQESDKTIIVPIHGNKDLSKGLFYSLLKQAGIEKSEI
jgi:predicted RNA binding protein YcfA (HicA-like mRNA interferase family)